MKQQPDAKAPDRRILVVDSDPTARRALESLALLAGFDVAEAENEREVPLQMLASHPSLVMLGIHGSDAEDGSMSEAIARVGLSVPVIAISDSPVSLELHAAVTSLGVDALTEKPLDPPLLIQTIHAMLEEPSLNRLQRLANSQFKTHLLLVNGRSIYSTSHTETWKPTAH